MVNSNKLKNVHLLSHNTIARGNVDIPQTGIMLQNVVAAEMIEGERSSVWCWIGCNSEVEQKLPEFFGEIQGGLESTYRSILRYIFAIMWQKAVVGQRVQHWARRPHYLSSEF